MIENIKALNVDLCQERAAIYQDSKYYLYNNEEKMCATYSSVERSCDMIFGPGSAPAYDAIACGDESNYFLDFTRQPFCLAIPPLCNPLTYDLNFIPVNLL